MTERPLAPSARGSSAVVPLVVGLVLVLLDVRVAGFDVLPDPVGWYLVLLGLSRLRRVLPRVAAARPWALVAGWLSLADVLALPPGSGTPASLLGVLAGAGDLVGVVAVVLLCHGVAAGAAGLGEPRTAARFRTFAWLVAVVGGLSALLGAAAGADWAFVATPALADAAAVVVPVLVFLPVAGAVVHAWLCFALWLLQGWPALQPLEEPAR